MAWKIYSFKYSKGKPLNEGILPTITQNITFIAASRMLRVTSYDGQSIWESKLWSLQHEHWTIRFQQLLVIGSLHTHDFLTDWQRSALRSHYSYTHIPCMEGSVPTCIPLAEHCKTHITTVKHTTPAINTFKFQGSFLGLEKWWRNGLVGKSPCCSFQVSASAWQITTTRHTHGIHACRQANIHNKNQWIFL